MGWARRAARVILAVFRLSAKMRLAPCPRPAETAAEARRRRAPAPTGHRRLQVAPTGQRSSPETSAELPGCWGHAEWRGRGHVVRDRRKFSRSEPYDGNHARERRWQRWVAAE